MDECALTMLEGKEQDPDYNEAAPPDRKRLKHLEDNGKFKLSIYISFLCLVMISYPIQLDLILESV